MRSVQCSFFHTLAETGVLGVSFTYLSVYMAHHYMMGRCEVFCMLVSKFNFDWASVYFLSILVLCSPVSNIISWIFIWIFLLYFFWEKTTDVEL